MKRPAKNTNLLRPMSIRDVPETTRLKFRIACMQSGYAMQDVMVECMKYLDDPEKVKEFMK
jgi:hypothetical protein